MNWLDKISSLYFIGIGGISMGGLAHYFIATGFKVAGSDLTTTGHRPENIRNAKPRPDLVIISAAVTPSSPGWVEVEEAKRLHIPVKDRAWLIGELMRQKGAYGIAIAGMHGKSTTTAMLGRILVEAGYDPLILGGAVMSEYGGSVRIPDWVKNDKIRMENDESNPKSKSRNNSSLGNSTLIRHLNLDLRHYLVAEACEYEKQFLQFAPKAVIITNLDKEHLDTYPKGLPQIIRAYRDFIKLVPSNGVAVVNGDDPNCQAVAKSARCQVKFFGQRKLWPGLRLQVIGQFNQLNATAAAHLAHELGIPSHLIQKALNNFVGINRRLQLKGEIGGALIYDDYGHHPTEIRLTLQAIKDRFPTRKVMVVFQPHQFIRTKQLLKEFQDVFRPADQVIIAPIYEVAGRDEPDSISNIEFTSAIKHSQIKLIDATYEKIAESIRSFLNKDTIVVTMGATPIYKVGERLLSSKIQTPNSK